MDQKWDMEILSVEKFAERYEELFHRSFESSKLHYIRFCKAENWSQAVEGTFAIPQKEHLRGEKTAFGYCVLPNRFIFIEYETKIEPMLREMKDYPNIDAASPLQFLFKFMEYLLEDDMIFLQGYEDNLEDLEDELLNNNLEDFNRTILAIRKELSVLSSYYEQLSDMGETLKQNAAEQGAEKEE